MYKEPNVKSSYLYPYSYGLHARNFTIILGVVSFIYIILLFFLVRKRIINLVFTIFLFFIILGLSTLGMLVVAMQERKLEASYTRDPNNYKIYDELVAEQIEVITEYLPEKELIKRYEYCLYERTVWLSRFYDFTMYVETEYDELVHYKAFYNEDMRRQKDFDDNFLRGFEVYEYYVEQPSISNRPVISYLFIFFNKYNNPSYIGAFINGERENPYFRYTRKG